MIERLWENLDEFTSLTQVPIEQLESISKDVCQHVKTYPIRVSGKLRIIHEPDKDFKSVLRTIDRQLKRFELPSYFYGSRKGVSVVDCCKVHSKNQLLLKIDLKDFFPSTGFRRVRHTLSKLTDDPQLIRLLTLLCTYNYALPQGFPTSPSLAEMSLLPLAKRLFGFCRMHDLKLTIYIDDICISGGKRLPVYQERILKYFREMHCDINFRKKKIIRLQEGESIMGLSINNGRLQIGPAYLTKYNKILSQLSLYDSSGQSILDGKLRASLRGHMAFLKQIDSERARLIESKLNSLPLASDAN